jgi:hypothetical protein
MMRRKFLKIGGVSALAVGISQGRMARGAETNTCYKPGDVINPEIFMLDAQQNKVRLLETAKPGTKLVVLAIVGGAYLTTTDKHGGIWCEDTLDEFANLKAVYNGWRDRGVQFVAVACPPVYSDKYGFPKDVFLIESESSPRYKSAVEKFIEKTEALRKDRTIPFDPVYYDPRFRLLWNGKEHAATAGYGTVYPWQGKFKWHKDEQRYSTPCVWFLSPNGRVLREPFYGNNYSAIPPKILFTYWELDGAIGQEVAKS